MILDRILNRKKQSRLELAKTLTPEQLDNYKTLQHTWIKSCFALSGLVVFILLSLALFLPPYDNLQFKTFIGIADGFSAIATLKMIRHYFPVISNTSPDSS